jgi:hypothetical protein
LHHEVIPEIHNDKVQPDGLLWGICCVTSAPHRKSLDLQAGSVLPVG